MELSEIYVGETTQEGLEATLAWLAEIFKRGLRPIQEGDEGTEAEVPVAPLRMPAGEAGVRREPAELMVVLQGLKAAKGAMKQRSPGDLKAGDRVCAVLCAPGVLRESRWVGGATVLEAVGTVARRNPTAYPQRLWRLNYRKARQRPGHDGEQVAAVKVMEMMPPRGVKADRCVKCGGPIYELGMATAVTGTVTCMGCGGPQRAVVPVARAMPRTAALVKVGGVEVVATLEARGVELVVAPWELLTLEGKPGVEREVEEALRAEGMDQGELEWGRNLHATRGD